MMIINLMLAALIACTAFGLGIVYEQWMRADEARFKFDSQRALYLTITRLRLLNELRTTTRTDHLIAMCTTWLGIPMENIRALQLTRANRAFNAAISKLCESHAFGSIDQASDPLWKAPPWKDNAIAPYGDDDPNEPNSGALSA